jgi:hypothetical protein
MKNAEHLYTVARFAVMAIILIWIIIMISGVKLSNWVLVIMGIALLAMIALYIFSFKEMRKNH